MSKIVWTPQDKQRRFLERPEREALYGGAAGGGKSDAMLAEALRQVHIPNYRGIIFRRTYPQLSSLIDRSRTIYSGAFPHAKYNETKHVWTFTSGAKIYFGSLQHEKDKYNYQGLAYDFIGFDELTHFSLTQYTYLLSRNRPTGAGTRVYVRATANPGGIGHGWVKQRFVTSSKPMSSFDTVVKIVDPNGKLIIKKWKAIFVPATVFDNDILLTNDPMYLASLGIMPEADKKALLYGDWDSFSGQVFMEWKNQPGVTGHRSFTHVINPFLIPKSWKVYRGFDFGYTKPFSVGWYAVDHDGRVYRIQELYGCTATPNEGVRWPSTKIAKKIKEIEEADHNLRGRDIIGIADPAIFAATDTGTSIADTMRHHGVYWQKGDNQRLPGKMQCHYRLAFDEEGYPMFYVFNNCKNFIRTIPELTYSERDVEDVNTDGEDHIYDEWRYCMAYNPIAPKINYVAQYDLGEDPLNLTDDIKKYKFLKI